MLHRSPNPSALGVRDAAALVPRAAARAYLATVAGIGGAATLALLAMSLASNSGGEAGRIAGLRGDGYAATLVTALAVDLSKPLR